ncbi:MAG TPA: T9SS type A sorting domain-containing protein, partial [Bacteroidia bacterium]|nr:T9SS type A sorting domain-containing protein [Bacteroidia bacterium]
YGSSSMHVMQHMPDGTYMAGPSMGGNKAQFGSSVAIGKNGNVVCAGTTSSYGQGDFDVYVIRFANDSIIQNYALAIISYADTPVVASVINPQTFIPGIKIFPNPATTSATILLQGLGEESYYVSLYNEVGLEVMNKTPFTHIMHDQSMVHIVTSDLSAGIYFYTISSNNERVGGGKLIVE